MKPRITRRGRWWVCRGRLKPPRPTFSSVFLPFLQPEGWGTTPASAYADWLRVVRPREPVYVGQVYRDAPLLGGLVDCP